MVDPSIIVVPCRGAFPWQLLSFTSDQPEVIARVQAVSARVAELELNADAFKAAVEVCVPFSP